MKTALRQAVKRSGLLAEGKKVVPYSGRYGFATISVLTPGIPHSQVRVAMRHSQRSTILERAHERVNVDHVADAYSAFPSDDVQIDQDKK